MARATIDETILTDIADSIREISNTDEPLHVEDFAEQILSNGGGEGLRVNYASATLLEDGNEISFETDLTEMPLLYVVLPTHASDLLGSVAYRLVTFDKGNMSMPTCTNNSKGICNASFTITADLDENGVLTFSHTNATYLFAAGVEYNVLYWG